MFAKVALLCAFVAAAHATSLYGSGLYNSGIVAPGLYNSRIVAPGLYNSGIVAPGLYNSGIVAPGLLNTVVAPGYAVKGAPFISAPVAYSTKSVVSAPLAYATRPVIAAPLAYAARPVVAAAPAAITTHKTMIGATSLLTGTPLVYNSGLYGNSLVGAAPYAYNTRIVSPIGLKGAGFLAGPGVVLK